MKKRMWGELRSGMVERCWGQVNERFRMRCDAGLIHVGFPSNLCQNPQARYLESDFDQVVVMLRCQT
jgi:hypothetical protein